MERIKRRLLAHRSVLAFGVIGVVNTFVHSGTVVALVEHHVTGPVAANVMGFVIANTCSFFANCRFTFHQAPSWERYRKFVAVSMLSLALTVGLSALAEALRWHYLVGLLLVLLCGPALTYVLHKAVTFRRV